jgi:ubiquitin-activating enzyme E1
MNTDLKIAAAIDDFLVETFIRNAHSTISPPAAVVGGIICQEILKTITGKFTPMTQFLAFGYIEAIPSTVEFELENDRYDAYRKVFRNARCDKMASLRYFLIKTGALGCKLLNNFALIGVATTGDGMVYTTDMDTIKRSNLSRQFLFRNTDIGQMKALVAARPTQEMNPAIRIDVQFNRLREETRNV